MQYVDIINTGIKFLDHWLYTPYLVIIWILLGILFGAISVGFFNSFIRRYIYFILLIVLFLSDICYMILGGNMPPSFLGIGCMLGVMSARIGGQSRVFYLRSKGGKYNRNNLSNWGGPFGTTRTRGVRFNIFK